VSCTEKPYHFVGQLGYYSHLTNQGTALSHLTQLGVRFYDPDIGRFTQRDAIRSPRLSYAYANDQPSIRIDPSGLYPTLVVGASCAKIGRDSETKAGIHQIPKAVWDEIDRQYTSAGMATCNNTITVECSKDLGKCGKSTVCGQKGAGSSFVISYFRECPLPKCIMLHEAIHVCMGTSIGTARWPVIVIPGCGNISGQHGPKWP